ncbi:multidrug resistance-associated protein 1 [Tetranychus urticae]|uniref:ABC-type glutathione-S-conjugate transporter n=1 Tax=Tetranychus urticae TaxID=32264 RepID=T1KDY0_TETUR|nr:multidrug resistance-associated protein 1 [Tetranychus urticae]
MDHKQVYLESLCGDSPFWDYNLSWNSTAPKLTRCFHQTILNWLPTTFLWLFSVYELTRTARIKKKPIPWNKQNRSRLILSLSCILINTLQLFNIIYRYFNSSDQPTPSDFYAPLLNIASFTLVTLFLYYQRLRGIHTSPVIWIYMFLQALCTFLINYQTWVDAAEYTSSEIVLFNVYFIVIALLFIVTSFADAVASPEDHELSTKQEQEHKKKISPEYRASFLNQLTFWWFNEMAILGWRKDLTTKDLWELRDDLKTENLIKPFESRFEEALLKAKKKSTQKLQLNGNTDKSPTDEAVKVKKVNFIPIFARIFGSYFIVGSFFKLIQDICQFVTPQLLKSLINFTQNPKEPAWHGFAIAFAMFAVSTIQSIFVNHYFYRMFMTGMQVSSTLTATIYKKSLNLGDKAKKEVTSGEIVNLMAVDAKRFLDLIPFINLIWSAPLQIVLAIYFLYLELGYSALFGLLVMILLIPFNGYIASVSRNMQIKLMKQKDERVKFMNEILSGIKIIKFYAWEKSFLQHVTGLRNKELQHLKNISYLGCASSFLWICAPTMVSVTTFAAYVLIQGETLTAQKAFVSLSLFNILRFPLTMLPQLITFYIMASVSIKRINNFLSYDDLDPYVTRNDEIDAISVEDACFKWGKKIEEKKEAKTKRRFLFKKSRKVEVDVNENGEISTALLNDEPTLQKINIRVKTGSFVAIVGSVGSGKSSLLSAILGEMEKVKGRININGKLRIAYVAQQAWIQNATLRDNILFGKPFDKTKYDKVIAACALGPDLAYLPGGDETEIGEKGINLSGGQKQRVSLARACYSDSDLYILDDPLSAVDAHVAKHIFKNVLSSKSGLLRNKTRVLVTNKLDILSKVDSIYVLTNGKISETGTFKELMDSKGDFSELVEQFTNRAAEQEEIEESFNESLDRKESLKESTSSAPVDNKNKKLIEVETAETGKVRWAVYFEYFKMVSVLWFIMIILSLITSNGFSLGSNVWLSSWTSDSDNANYTLDHTKMRLEVYGALGLGQGIVTFIGSWLLVVGTIRASVGFHRDLLYQIFRSPMSFFDTTPTGRIVNRFSKDIDTVDSIIPQNLRSWLLCFFQVLSTFVIISYSTPLFIIALVPICCVYAFIQRIYVASSRQLKRLESVTRSPIYSHFGETLNGVSTIRAFDVSDRFIQESADKVDHNLCCYYPNAIANRWLGIRLEFCGNMILLFAALFAVFSRKQLDSGTVGLSVSYALSITATLNWLVRMSSELETNIVAVERILEYCKIQSEADWYEAKVKPDDSWPEKGSIKFNNYETRYREGTELVLKGITADIKSKEKVGIVGRTGAGKSTVTLSLFRLIEPAGGNIFIDQYNISDLPLHPLRSRLAIIPQDPVLFGGKLRFNLDPFNIYSDNEIWDALSHAHLKDFVSNTGEGLDYSIAEEGKNLSVGQRQLLCLARALLKKPKILFLDEATAAIDLETDSLIQKTIRSEFKDCTILTIAHRLNTIMDSDRVLVLDKGKVAEFDTPEALLDKKDSIFYSLAKEANLVL